MPGIVGLVTSMPPQRARAELQQMLAALRHESFYVARTWIDEELGIYLGWTAREGSFSDAGPQQNETGDVTLIFSGEEYPSPDVIAALKSRGHSIDTGRAAYLVHQYEDDPAGFASRLNGFFHAVLIDRRRRIVTLLNDRYGMHRLYWHEARDTFYFGAEAKAILRVRPALRSISPRALGESVLLGCVLENRTLFEGIEVLPGASRWTFEGGLLRHRGHYFQPREWEEQPHLDPEAFYQEVKRVFVDTLPRYLDGPERIGMSLTGGLDTRMIMAWLRESPGSVPCYTWGGPYRDCEDVKVARRVAAACGQRHEVVEVGGPFLARFAHYADRAIFLTDGCVDASMAPDVYMNEQARRIAPVRLTGLYGGEVLRRVRSFKPMPPAPGLYAPEVTAQFAAAQTAYQGLFTGHPLSFAVFRQAPWHHQNCLSLEETQLTMRTPFLDNDFVRTVFQAPESACRTDDVSMRLIADGSAALSRIPTDRGLGGRGRPAEAVAHAFQEFLFKAEYAFDYGMPQWLARLDHATAGLHLERLFLGRHKPHHFRVWYRDQLAPYLREVLLDPRSLSRPYVDGKVVERLIAAHTRGNENHTSEIHKLLKLELLHRQLVDRPVPATALEASMAMVH